MVLAPRMSGSTAGTAAGGLGGGSPTMFFMIQAPRITGEVVVPLAVTFMIAPWVINPPWGLHSGNGALRSPDPSTDFRP